MLATTGGGILIDSIPAGWGDWRPCKLCGVVQPPRELSEDGCCKDVDWCIRQRHRPVVPTNGAHKTGDTKLGEVPVEVCCKDGSCQIPKPKRVKVKRKKK